jgi:hypothetical protein
MPLRRPLPSPPESASAATPTTASERDRDAKRPPSTRRSSALSDVHDARPDKTLSSLVQPLASLSLEPRRPTPLPRLPSSRKKPRMSDDLNQPEYQPQQQQQQHQQYQPGTENVGDQGEHTSDSLSSTTPFLARVPMSGPALVMANAENTTQRS